MSTCVFEKDLYTSADNRKLLIESLRSALVAAENGQEHVSISNNGIEITWDLSEGEFFVIA